MTFASRHCHINYGHLNWGAFYYVADFLREFATSPQDFTAVATNFRAGAQVNQILQEASFQ
ncbi:hypothetical protein [Bowmanella yangjiangensis]|uniref:hypothetical protein n=1 Tax=Bowmanella yangjiangensis TaxID=2811230 RepID=UPI0038CC08C1